MKQKMKKRGFCVKGKPNEVLAEYTWLIEFCKTYELEPTIDVAMRIEELVSAFRSVNSEVHNDL